MEKLWKPGRVEGLVQRGRTSIQGCHDHSFSLLNGRARDKSDLTSICFPPESPKVSQLCLERDVPGCLAKLISCLACLSLGRKKLEKQASFLQGKGWQEDGRSTALELEEASEAIKAGPFI